MRGAVLGDTEVMSGQSYIPGRLPCALHLHLYLHVLVHRLFGGRPLLTFHQHLNCNPLLIRTFPEFLVRTFTETLVRAISKFPFAAFVRTFPELPVPASCGLLVRTPLPICLSSALSPFATS